MGKRSSFQKNRHDQYYTPLKPVKPLVPHLPKTPFTYAEPCAGNGSLITHLKSLIEHGECLIKSDIEPGSPEIEVRSAFNQSFDNVDMIITNPPWTREILHDMIVYFSDQKPTWLLFDADWMYTDQSIPYMERCREIVPIGRVKWIEGTQKTGKDNAAWYLFDKKSDQTIFHPRIIV
jgi:hypothetical protein